MPAETHTLAPRRSSPASRAEFCLPTHPERTTAQIKTEHHCLREWGTGPPSALGAKADKWDLSSEMTEPWRSHTGSNSLSVPTGRSIPQLEKVYRNHSASKRAELHLFGGHFWAPRAHDTPGACGDQEGHVETGDWRVLQPPRRKGLSAQRLKTGQDGDSALQGNPASHVNQATTSQVEPPRLPWQRAIRTAAAGKQTQPVSKQLCPGHCQHFPSTMRLFLCHQRELGFSQELFCPETGAPRDRSQALSSCPAVRCSLSDQQQSKDFPHTHHTVPYATLFPSVKWNHFSWSCSPQPEGD